MPGRSVTPAMNGSAQALLEVNQLKRAYEEAGYKPHDGNCIRLRGNERVKARLAELQAEIAKENVVSVGSLLAELEMHGKSHLPRSTERCGA